jgi:MarR family transcriptional regulator, organic hydroperoxide resistance regulator
MAQRSTASADTEIQSLDPVLQFLRLMWAVDHKLQSVSKRMTTRIGLTGPQRFAVRCIGRRPGLAAGELATLLHLDPGTVTGILKRLEDARMIEREQDASDGRRMRLTLTRAGRAVDRRSAGTVENAIRRVLASASPADLAGAGRVFRRLASELDAVAVSEGAPAAKRRRVVRN